MNEYTSGPEKGFAYLLQHRLHGRRGSAFLYPTLWPRRKSQECEVMMGWLLACKKYLHLSHSYPFGNTSNFPSLSRGCPSDGVVVGRPSLEIEARLVPVAIGLGGGEGGLVGGS